MALRGSRAGTNATAASSTNVGIFPNLTPTQFDANFTNMHRWQHHEGFSGNGDYITVVNASNALEYFNSSDVLQWSKARTDINAAADAWCGAYLDKTDNVIYAVVIDTATTPDTFYLASIDSAGTITNIGNGQPTTDFTTTPNIDTSSGPNAQGASMIQRAADGSGNIFVRMAITSGATASMEEMEIDITDGSIATDTAQIGLTRSTSSARSTANYKTADGLYIGQFLALAGGGMSCIIHNASGQGAEIMVPVGTGVPGNNQFGVGVILWKGKVTVAYGSESTNTEFHGPRVWEKTVFDAWVKEVAQLAGITV